MLVKGMGKDEPGVIWKLSIQSEERLKGLRLLHQQYLACQKDTRSKPSRLAHKPQVTAASIQDTTYVFPPSFSFKKKRKIEQINIS